jgi:hypothetical protein
MSNSATWLSEPNGFSMPWCFSVIVTAHMCKGCVARSASKGNLFCLYRKTCPLFPRERQGERRHVVMRKEPDFDGSAKERGIFRETYLIPPRPLRGILEAVNAKAGHGSG